VRRPLVSFLLVFGGLGCGAAEESVSAAGLGVGGSIAGPGGTIAGAGTAGGAGGTTGAGGGTTGAGGTGGTTGAGGTLSGPGGGATGATGGSSGGGVCESNTVRTARVSPEMLIVLDRSLSMQQGSRWTPSVSGLKAITSALQADVAFGLMAFPGTSGGNAPIDCFALSDPQRMGECLALQDLGGSGMTCNAGSLNVPVGYNNAATIAQALDGMAPDGATPTAVTLQAARAELEKLVTGPDQLASPKYVLLVTDGAPNCTDGSLGVSGQDQAAVSASLAAIQAMAQSGIKTYVLGYDTQKDATLRSVLDQMARAGGTGDSAHRAIENESGLITAFQQITSTALACEFALEKPVIDKIYVRVVLDGRQLGVEDPNGWVLSPDRRKVRLQGGACTALSGAGHILNVTVECEPVLPPI
jgi:hypothetical protein